MNLSELQELISFAEEREMLNQPFQLVLNAYEQERTPHYPPEIMRMWGFEGYC